MDAVGDNRVNLVVCMKAAQVAWTEVLNNCVGAFICDDPCPMLMIQPTLELAEHWSKKRLAPMLRDTPSLRGKVSDPRSRDSDNTIKEKGFPGGYLAIIGANAPTGLASRPIRLVLADEVDRYGESAGTEGDPLKLADQRQQTFWNRKTLMGSTPGDKATSRVNREYERSDMRKYFVPCPDCSTHQIMMWERVQWDVTEEESAYPSRKHPGKFYHPETAHYVCSECGSIWDDNQRWEAINKGEWRVTKKNASTGVVGFHITGFMSPWRTFGQMAEEFLKARYDPQELKVWTNTVLGEPWEDVTEKVESATLTNRGENYSTNSLPQGVRLLTAGVDVHPDRLEVQVLGFGTHEETWAVDYHVLLGDPSTNLVWTDLDSMLLSSYRREDGQELRIRAACIDSGGHHGNQVLSFCAYRQKARRIYAIKGASGPRPIWPLRSTKTKNNFTMWVIGVDTAKDAIYGRLRIKRHGPGYFHFPKNEKYEQPYFDQLTSERVMLRKRKTDGKNVRVWFLPPGARNEALDTAVYAIAARKSLAALRLDIAPPRTKPIPVSDEQAATVPMIPQQPVATQPVVQPQQTRPAHTLRFRRVFRSRYMQ